MVGEPRRRARGRTGGSLHTPRPLPGMMLHQDGSRHAWLKRQPQLDLIVTLDDATGAKCSAFLVEEEGAAANFRALKEVFREHGLPMSLYTDRGARYFSRPRSRRRNRPRSSDPGRSGASPTRDGAHRRLFAAGPGTLGARAFATLQDRLVNELGLAGVSDMEAANAFIREVSLFPHTMPASPLRRPAGSLSPRFRASISMRSSAPRRSARSAMTIASPSGSSNSRSRKARCGRISSGRGSRSTSPPTARMPSSTGRLHRPLRRERNDPGCAKRRLNPLGGKAVEEWTSLRLPTLPRQKQNQKQRTLDALPKPDNLIRYRQFASSSAEGMSTEMTSPIRVYGLISRSW